MGIGSLNTAAEPIRVLCVDDHAVVREGVAAILRRHSGIEVVGFAATGVEAVTEFCTLRPDVTLMDLRLPEADGFDAIRRIRRIDPQAAIIVLSMYRGDEDLRRALEAGAAAFLLKDTLADRLVDTIREAFHRGPGTMAPAAARRGLLSPREQEVLRLLAKGLRNKEVGVVLQISEGTVDVHVKRIYAKLQVHDRTGALMTALERGIIHLD